MNQNKRLYGIRGAVCVENSINSIQGGINQLFMELFQKNNLDEDDIVSIQFTVTDDLDVLNPATALRRSGYAHDCALFCATEPTISGAISGVIRVLITAYLLQKPQQVYINGAEVLRPDILSKLS